MKRRPHLIVFSGAGLSAESGLPTFRGASGLWEGIPIRRVCHIETWQDNFEAVHEFYDARRRAGAQAKPNAAHDTIAAWQKSWPGRTTLLTQNIDQLLERAGAVEVVHLHGHINLLWCVECKHRWDIGSDSYDRAGCPACGRRESVKPDVVFFGENAPRYGLLHETVADLRAEDTVIVIGTSGTVLPADRLFAYSKAYSILVNLEPGQQMDEGAFSESHYGPATEILPKLSGILRQRMGYPGEAKI
jgi:NAD-dependent deacetylase